MKYLLTTLMSIIVLTFVACGDDTEDTAVAEDTAVVDAGADTGEGEGEGEGADAGPADVEDGGSDE